MADVQLAHGFLKLANQLDEAAIRAPFSSTQAKIVRCLIRLTYGWRQRTARVAHPAIAAACGVAYSASFRRAFGELLAADVVFEVAPGTGRMPGLYAINKDFESWGPFRVEAAALARAFPDRPASDDDRLTAFLRDRRPPSRGQSMEGNGDDDSARRPPSEGQATESVDRPQKGSQNSVDRPLEARRPPSRGHATAVDRPPEGSHEPPNTPSINDLRAPKDSTTQEIQTASSIRAHAREGTAAAAGMAAPAPDEAIESYAAGLASAANDAIGRRWPSHQRTLATKTGVYAARQLLAMHVPITFAAGVIASKCKTTGLDEPPKSVRWFLDAIVEAFHADAHAAVTRDEGKRSRAKSEITRLGETIHGVDPQIAAQRAQLDATHDEDFKRYQLLERRTARAWVVNHREEARAIVRNVAESITGESPFWDRMRKHEVQRLCAQRAGFQSFDTWRANRPPPTA